MNSDVRPPCIEVFKGCLSEVTLAVRETVMAERHTPTPWDDVFQRGMRAQLSTWRQRLALGERRIGWKMGYMDAALRARLGLPHPLVGFLTSGRLLPDGGVLPCAAHATLLAESEVALRLGRDLAPGCTPREAAAAIDALAPAMEIVDMTQPQEDLQQVLAGNLFHAAVVLGTPMTLPGLVSLPDITGGLWVNATQQGAVDAASLLQNPGALLAQVTGLLGQFGEGLRAGDWIITGSVVKPWRVQAGDEVVVDLGGLGRVALRLEADG